MAKINILDPSVYNLIAAGEVVERPASVVKELIENSIDAGAKNITISISNGGTTFIQVSDDGCGIEEDDFKSAFLPHATSKVKDAQDLDNIFTLGFRGEALASIAAVSKVNLTSKTSEAEIGASLDVEGGKFSEIKKVQCKPGTTITVKDLFFCVPARAKFLKKNKSEEQENTNVLTRIILAHPEINFNYFIDGKKSLTSLGSTKREALFSVYGKEAVNETLEIFAERENVSVSGFVGKPTFSKANRTYQTLIVNGRYVVNLTVQTAVSNAYGDFLMKRQYPFFVIYLNLPPEEVDVNVHPNKLDVKFLKTSLIYSTIFEAVSRALMGMDYVKQIDETNASKSFVSAVSGHSAQIDKCGVNLNPFSGSFHENDKEENEKTSEAVLDMILSNDDSSLRDNFGLGSKLLERINLSLSSQDEKPFSSQNYDVDDEGKKAVASESFASQLNDDKFKEKTQNYEKKNAIQDEFLENEIKLVGKIFNTYLIIEWGDNMFLIDQHAAHERLRYEKLKSEFETGNIVIQPMLVPFVISLNFEDDQIIRSNLEAIKSVGFEIEEFGDRTYKISSVPSVVADIDFNKFFNLFLEEKLGKQKITEAELLKDNLMQMACKSAVKGGDDLSRFEINDLLKQMSEKNIILFCPHGRPVAVRITKKELEKWFKRIV